MLLQRGFIVPNKFKNLEKKRPKNNVGLNSNHRRNQEHFAFPTETFSVWQHSVKQPQTVCFSAYSTIISCLGLQARKETAKQTKLKVA